MMAKSGSSKQLVRQQEKLVKKKARPKKDAQNAPEHGKVKTKSPGNDVRSPRDRIRGVQTEKNVARQINKQHIPLQTRKSQVSEVTKREQSQIGQKKITRSPAQEVMKKCEVKVLRRTQYSSVTSGTRNKPAPSQPTLRTSAENQATVSRTTSTRAQALLVEMVQQSRLNIPGAQQHGLSALATELDFEQKSAETADVFDKKKLVPGGEAAGEGVNSRKEDGVGIKSRNYLQEDDVAQIVIPEVSESTEPRFIAPKEVSSFEDWRPAGSQRINKPPCAEKNQWLRVEMEKQQELRVAAQKKAPRKKELSNLKRLERAVVDDTNNTTPLSIYSSQSIANSTIWEDVEESARGYAKFLYRPGAAWKNLGSDSASSMRSCGLREVTESRPTSRDSRKSTTEIVQAISSASARREAMRKELAARLRENLLRKKLLISQNRAAARAHNSQCKCC